MSSRYPLGNRDPYALTYEYDYGSEPGKDVNIYVVDTGSSLCLTFSIVTNLNSFGRHLY